jgi:hypothetical protein
MGLAKALDILREIRALLDRYRAEPWASRIRELEARADGALRQGPDWARQEAVDELRDLFGGMGSFDDAVISSLKGDAIAGSREAAVNAELSRLRDELYETLRDS